MYRIVIVYFNYLTAGVSIGEDGPSQMALEDLAMFQSLPGRSDIPGMRLLTTDRHRIHLLTTDRHWILLLTTDRNWILLLTTNRHWILLLTTDRH